MKVDIITTVDVDDVYQADDIAKIFNLLVEKGALSGVKGGKTIIHFDATGKFQAISFDYIVWKEKALDR